MGHLPKISVVTPTLNQASFIEETIQSVLGQGYPDLEYRVVDGGSTDNTLDILKRYDGQLSWLSEADSGQANAVNKGLRLATGDVLAFLNSDDLYEPGALLTVGEYFANHAEAAWLTGKCINIDQFGKVIRQRTRLYKNVFLTLNQYSILQVLNFISQPATFWRRTATQRIGFLDERLHYTMDYEYWLRLGKQYRLHFIPRDLACFRIHRASKSGSTIRHQFDEELAVASRYCSPMLLFMHRLYHPLIIEIYRRTSQVP